MNKEDYESSNGNVFNKKGSIWKGINSQAFSRTTLVTFNKYFYNFRKIFIPKIQTNNSTLDKSKFPFGMSLFVYYILGFDECCFQIDFRL